jgi:hypothetical protein
MNWLEKILILLCAVFFMFIVLGERNNNIVKKEKNNIIDSLKKENIKIDSLYRSYSIKEDSIIIKTDSIIKEIDIYYEKKINIIDSLPIDDQIELLSDNLSSEINY